MITIQTRQQANGDWWCNTTLGGYDISVEGKSVVDAQLNMSSELLSKGFLGECTWDDPKLYPHQPVRTEVGIGVGFKRIRLDENPIG